MGAHLALLLERVSEFRRQQRTEDDVYVWWGKVRSANRQQPLPHLADVLAIDEELSDDAPEGADPEIHLYLTDYRSLYVAHVGGITAEEPNDGDGHIPSYYREHNLACDCWFQLWDIRRLVADDTVSVIDELRRLRNVRYHDRPVSMYGGMVELPLVVRREDDARYFDPALRDSLIDGRYWCEFDSERSGIGAMERELRENLLGEQAWSALDPAARTFVASAEEVFRKHRSDAAFDFTGVVVDLAKTFEVQTNVILRRAMSGTREDVRRANVDGRPVDLARGRALTLGELARVIADDRRINDFLKQRLANGLWFAASLPPILRDMADIRNPAAHEKTVGREAAAQFRNRCVGVGGLGALVELARCATR